MKTMKRLTAALMLVVVMLVTVLPVSAADGTLVYSTESNSGVRHIVCTTLAGTSAGNYYTGNYTYETLSQLSGTALFNKLNELLTQTHTKDSTYSDCRDMAVQTDCEANDGRVNLIYTSYSATRADYGGNTGTWNREHVWPKSLGGFDTDGPGADLHHIRPSDAKANSTRGNDLYGYVTNGNNAIASSLVGSSVVAGKKGGGYFEPLDNVKGDVARICLYVYARYGADTDYPKCAKITNVFQDVDTLLEWCALDPVDTWEMGRNEVVGAFQGNRNVFIDYPEYAWLLFGKEVPTDLITPSSDAADEIPACRHTETALRNAKTATCAVAGYTGDRYCNACKQLVETGRTIPVKSHVFEKDGKQLEYCYQCGTTQTASTTPEKNDQTVIIIIVAASAVAVVGSVIIIKKKRNKL